MRILDGARAQRCGCSTDGSEVDVDVRFGLGWRESRCRTRCGEGRQGAVASDRVWPAVPVPAGHVNVDLVPAFAGVIVDVNRVVGLSWALALAAATVGGVSFGAFSNSLSNELGPIGLRGPAPRWSAASSPPLQSPLVFLAVRPYGLFGTPEVRPA